METREGLDQLHRYQYADESFSAEISHFTIHLSFVELVASQTLQKNLIMIQGQHIKCIKIISFRPRFFHQVKHPVPHWFFDVFWIFLWPTPVFLFVFFKRSEIWSSQGTGKNANSRSQLCTEEAFSIGEGHPWMMQDLHPRNERMRCFFFPMTLPPWRFILLKKWQWNIWNFCRLKKKHYEIGNLITIDFAGG